MIRHFRGKSVLSLGDRWMAAAPSRPDKSSRKKEALSLQNRMKLLRHPHQSAVGQNRSSIVHLNRCIMHLSPHSLTHSRKNFSFFDALSAFTAARGGAPRGCPCLLRRGGCPRVAGGAQSLKAISFTYSSKEKAERVGQRRWTDGGARLKVNRDISNTPSWFTLYRVLAGSLACKGASRYEVRI